VDIEVNTMQSEEQAVVASGKALKSRPVPFLAAAAVGIVGVFLTAVYTTPRSFGIPLMGLATAWILTTGVAWAAIVRRKVVLHKEWMIRSYLVVFAFVTFRFITDLLPGVTAKLG